MDLLKRDVALSTALRPSSIEDFIGQEQAVAVIKAMTHTGKLSDSLLFIGGPGLGKTTLAMLTTEGTMYSYIGGQMQQSDDVITALQHLRRGDTMFIDEVHSAKVQALESIYSALEDGYIHSGGRRRMLAQAQLVAATTEPGKVPAPLRDRFGQILYLEPYSAEEIRRILTRSVTLMGSSLDGSGLDAIVQRSHGVPRIANRLLRRAADFGATTASSLESMWQALNIDSLGLNKLDQRVLHFLAAHQKPVGAANLARRFQIDTHTLETMVEPYLLRMELIEIGARGRQITLKGSLHLADGS